MHFLLTACFLSFMTFVVISIVFRSELRSSPRLRVQIDVGMLGVLLFLFVILTGLLGEADPSAALYGLVGVLLAFVVYRSIVGWPSGQLVMDAFRRQGARKHKPATTVRGPEDDPDWLNYSGRK